MTKRYKELTINQKINTKGNNQHSKGGMNKTLIGAASRWYALTDRRDFGLLK